MKCVDVKVSIVYVYNYIYFALYCILWSYRKTSIGDKINNDITKFLLEYDRLIGTI